MPQMKLNHLLRLSASRCQNLCSALPHSMYQDLSTCHGLPYFRWLDTVLRAVSGNLRDGASFKLDKQTWRRKSNDTQKPISQNLLIKIL